MTGKCSFKPSAICVTPSGRPTSNAHGSGTNRTWIASTKTPRPAAPISSNWSRCERLSLARAFLTELTLDPPDATSDQAGVPLLDEDYLILSTIHSAKGQEWKSVFVLNVVDGCMPSDLGAGTSAELEEERRLLYVAMTRAKDDLHLTIPQRFFTHGQNAKGDRHVYASRTRFIPESLLPMFERTTWPSAPAASARAASQGPRIDIGARMRGMWR
jgi:DNA helicase-2/ATP-dependent DNA helicase PcrA